MAPLQPHADEGTRSPDVVLPSANVANACSLPFAQNHGDDDGVEAAGPTQMGQQTGPGRTVDSVLGPFLTRNGVLGLEAFELRPAVAYTDVADTPGPSSGRLSGDVLEPASPVVDLPSRDDVPAPTEE